MKKFVLPPQKIRNLDRSPFKDLKSKKKLAGLLNISDFSVLEDLVSKQSENYKCYQLKGGKRYVEEPKPKLKKVQKRIHSLLIRSSPPSFLHSGFKGRSAVTNAMAHKPTDRLVKVDIRKFYPSSDGRKVHSFFTSLGCSEDVADWLWRLCVIMIIDQYGNTKTHLPTGGVTSPVLAYYAYADMFGELSELAAKYNLNFSVLADDVTFSGDCASGLVRRDAEGIIRKHGLTPNLRKGRVISARDPNKHVTGVNLTPKGYRIPRVQWDKEMNLQKNINNEDDPKKRARLYQQQIGLLFAGAQIEPKARKSAIIVMNKWRADTPAWKAHQSLSGCSSKKKS